MAVFAGGRVSAAGIPGRGASHASQVRSETGLISVHCVHVHVVAGFGRVARFTGGGPGAPGLLVRCSAGRLGPARDDATSLAANCPLAIITLSTMALSSSSCSLSSSTPVLMLSLNAFSISASSRTLSPVPQRCESSTRMIAA